MVVPDGGSENLSAKVYATAERWSATLMARR